jgi:hypothetical protein
VSDAILFPYLLIITIEKTISVRRYLISLYLLIITIEKTISVRCYLISLYLLIITIEKTISVRRYLISLYLLIFFHNNCIEVDPLLLAWSGLVEGGVAAVMAAGGDHTLPVAVPAEVPATTVALKLDTLDMYVARPLVSA